jgi:hypothetical protein
VSPLSWSADGHGDSFSNDRQDVFDKIAKLNICNVIILSGDMHFGAAYRHHHGRVTEFSASPFQAFPFWPLSDPQNDIRTGYKRIFIHGGLNFYFGKVTLEPDKVRFEVFRWPTFLPQSTPTLFETLDMVVNPETGCLHENP